MCAMLCWATWLCGCCASLAPTCRCRITLTILVCKRARQALEESPKVYKAESGRYAGAFVIETGGDPPPGEERKCEVLIRSNGIPTYVGKDIAYHMWKFHLLPDRLKYVQYASQPNGD